MIFAICVIITAITSKYKISKLEKELHDIKKLVQEPHEIYGK